MKKFKNLALRFLCCGIAFLMPLQASAEVGQKPAATMVEITTRDFKTFAVGENVRIYRVSFSNQYAMEVVGNLFVPKRLKGKAGAIVIGHPMGAVKEQSSSVYGAQLAARGFVTLAVDQQFWGESGGIPRHGVAPDIYAETFSAAVDFLGTRDFVDREKIGIIGICGSGGFVISAAKIDPRMKAVATVSMYNIGDQTRAQLLFGDINPKLAQLTDDVLFGDVWKRPGLSPRDRSLVTVSALIAMNRPDQLRGHLERALANGLTEAELVEAFTHLAFYAGWANGSQASIIAKEVFQKK